MRAINTLPSLWTVLLIALLSQTTASTFYSRLSYYDQMKCSYGERGSLTATCINATPSFFRATPYRFDHLDETLRCINCTLTTIESGTFDLNGNQIKYLDLHSSRIELIKPRAFVGLIFLETLDLSYNQISEIFAETFAGVKKINKIDLSYNLITGLADDAFAELFNLENLILNNNGINTIASKAFHNLSNLAYLDLSVNSITKIPVGAFNNLTRLVTLDLTENNISNLRGNEFYNLTSLLLLDLTRNHLSSPVIEIAAGNRLKKLILAKNSIDRIVPDSLMSLTNLQTLDLQINQIHDISMQSFKDMFNLDTLDLSDNMLTKFQTNWFSGLPQLEALNCSHNAINTVEIVGLIRLNNLYSLDLSHNNITDLDYSGLIARLPKLSYLRLEGNLLPCDLEKEINTYFEEDNFKFVLYSENVDMYCEDIPISPTQNDGSLNDLYVGGPLNTINSSEIWVLVFLSLAVVLIAVLFYLQCRTYSDLKNGGAGISDLPRAHLVPSNYETGEFS